MFDETVTVDTSIDPGNDTVLEAALPEELERTETIDDPQEDIVTVPSFAALPRA
jgi:hypothetical protein